METTIQLDKNTVQALRMLKMDMGARSYNQVILRLMPQKLPSSMFGSNKRLSKFSSKDRLEEREV